MKPFGASSSSEVAACCGKETPALDSRYINLGGYRNFSADDYVEVSFKTEKLRKLFNNRKSMIRAFGQLQADKIQVRLDDLDAAPTLEAVRNLPGHYHELFGDRVDEIAVTLKQPYRLVFTPAHDPMPRKSDGGLDWMQVTAVRILEVVDYHD